jgi:hypothetical protein
MNQFKDNRDTEQATQWLKQNGIKLSQIHDGEAELFQAQRLATRTLQDCGRLLEQNQAHTLNSFLKQVLNKKLRLKITQGQCFKVMNIAKQAQRRMAKTNKAR